MKDLNQWFRKKAKGILFTVRNIGEKKREKNNYLTSRKEIREPSVPVKLELAEFRSWGYKGTSSKIISLFHKFLRRKRTINTLKRQLLSVSLDQGSWLVNTMVTLNWVRRLESARWWRCHQCQSKGWTTVEWQETWEVARALRNLPFWAQWLVLPSFLWYFLVPRIYEKRN